MKNNKYWEDRANERMSNYHKNADETVFKINNAYDAAMEDINKEINKIFYTFQSQSGLSIEEAKALLNSNISESELEDIKSKINGIQDKDLKKYLMAELNAKAYKARMTRLEALKESIKVNSAKVAEVQLKEGQKSFINTINDAYYKNIFDTQKGTGLGFDFSSMPVDRIEEILKNNWSGKNYSERVWNNTEALASKLEETLTTGLMQGKGSRKMAAEIEDLSDYGKMASERLIRTETTYVANAAEMESYKECDIDKYVFVATLDLRTSDICREHDGNIIEVKKGVSGDNLPPLHPYCRSTTIAYMGEEWYKNLKRRARDPETGKTYTVPGNMNYNEWYKKNVVDKYGEQKAETFEKMIKNKASDKKQYAKYKDMLGKDSPKSFTDFQNLKYNNSEEWNLIKDYIKSRSSNMISVFTPYSQYKEYKNIIQNEIVGLTTSNGIKITGQSKHFIDRVFGTTKDPHTNRFRDGVEIEDIKDALLNGVVRERKTDIDSIKLVTDRCMVSINPNTGNLIQTNP